MSFGFSEERSLDFLSLLVELYRLVDHEVQIEFAATTRSSVVSLVGELWRPIDVQLDLGASIDGPATLAFAVGDADATFTLRERDLVFACLCIAEQTEARFVQIRLRGGVDVVISERDDALLEPR